MIFELPERKQIRMPGYDYSQPGYYFVTICTKDGQDFFGEIGNGIMGFSEMGCLAAKFWQEIPNHFEDVMIDEWVVMPNHVHGIVCIDSQRTGTRHGASVQFGPLISKSLPSIINHYKGSVTRWCRQNGFDYFEWQSRYHERIIRNKFALDKIRKYIFLNPIKWELDRNNQNPK